MLSRDADRLQRIRALERGGDDVVRKPFAYSELRVRAAAVLRRSEPGRLGRIMRAGPVVVDVRSREVRVFDRRVELSAKEYDLLVCVRLPVRDVSCLRRRWEQSRREACIHEREGSSQEPHRLDSTLLRIGAFTQ